MECIIDVNSATRSGWFHPDSPGAVLKFRGNKNRAAKFSRNTQTAELFSVGSFSITLFSYLLVCFRHLGIMWFEPDALISRRIEGKKLVLGGKKLSRRIEMKPMAYHRRNSRSLVTVFFFLVLTLPIRSNPHQTQEEESRSKRLNSTKSNISGNTLRQPISTRQNEF